MCASAWAPGQTLAMPARAPDTLGAFFRRPRDQARQGCAHSSMDRSRWIPPGRSLTGPVRPLDVVIVRARFAVPQLLPPAISNREDRHSTAKDGLYSLITTWTPMPRAPSSRPPTKSTKGMFGSEFARLPGLLRRRARLQPASYRGRPSCWRSSGGRRATTFNQLPDRCSSPQDDEETGALGRTTGTSGAASSRYVLRGLQAEWCAQNNVEYLVHLNHEESC